MGFFNTLKKRLFGNYIYIVNRPLLESFIIEETHFAQKEDLVFIADFTLYLGGKKYRCIIQNLKAESKKKEVYPEIGYYCGKNEYPTLEQLLEDLPIPGESHFKIVLPDIPSDLFAAYMDCHKELRLEDFS